MYQGSEKSSSEESRLEVRSEKLLQSLTESLALVGSFAEYVEVVQQMTAALRSEEYFGVGDEFYARLSRTQSTSDAAEKFTSPLQQYAYQALVVTEAVRSESLRRIAKNIPVRSWPTVIPTSDINQAARVDADNKKYLASSKKEFDENIALILHQTTDFAIDNLHIQHNFLSLLVIAEKSGICLSNNIHQKIIKARKK